MAISPATSRPGRARPTPSTTSPGQFDLVIVNSVVQYFPTASYLDDVIEQAVARTRPGGTVFVGDAYHLALREAMQTSIVVEQAAPDAATELLRSRVLHRIASQTELLLDPAYFARLAARSAGRGRGPGPSKFGAYDNEMTRFRYDAVIQVGGDAGPSADVPWHDWQDDGLDAGSLRALLAVTGTPASASPGYPTPGSLPGCSGGPSSTAACRPGPQDRACPPKTCGPSPPAPPTTCI